MDDCGGSEIDTLIISDLHLELPFGREKDAGYLIGRLPFRRLILLGDISARLNKKFLIFLSDLKVLAAKKPEVEIVCVVGNHDGKKVLHSLLAAGVAIEKEYSWFYNDKKYFAIHGHQFNGLLVRHKLIYRLAEIFYALSSWVDRKQRLNRMLKRQYFRIAHPSYKIAVGAVAYCRGRGVDCIIAAHTHQPMRGVDIDNILCLNAGCFDDCPGTFIVIGSRGERLYEF